MKKYYIIVSYIEISLTKDEELKGGLQNMGLEVIKSFDEDLNQWRVKPIGEIDIYTSADFKNTLLKLIEEKNTDINIIGTSLDYIDSTGLGVLISVIKQMKESETTIIISDIKPSIKKLLELTSLDKVFTIKE